MQRTLRNLACLGGGAFFGWSVAKLALRQARWFEYLGKVCVVTGGSRGLGLEIARLLVDRGAKVAICARTLADVEEASRELRQRGGEVLGNACDVTNPPQVEAFMNAVIQRFGRVDVLFNVAGIMQVGPLDAMTREDFERAMAVNCWGPLNTTLAVLPHMRGQGWGRILNVGSIGGKRAVPHMVPYDTSKFALVGLSAGLRTELAKDGIVVTTANPSLMRTGSARNADFKGRHRQEYAWFKLGGGMPLVSLSSKRAAEQILRASQGGEGEVYIANAISPTVLASQLAPALTAEVLAVVNRLLPSMGGVGRRAKKGYESESAITRSPLASLADAAAQQNNEM